MKIAGALLKGLVWRVLSQSVLTSFRLGQLFSPHFHSLDHEHLVCQTNMFSRPWQLVISLFDFQQNHSFKVLQHCFSLDQLGFLGCSFRGQSRFHHLTSSIPGTPRSLHLVVQGVGGTCVPGPSSDSHTCCTACNTTTAHFDISDFLFHDCNFSLNYHSCVFFVLDACLQADSISKPFVVFPSRSSQSFFR